MGIQNLLEMSETEKRTAMISSGGSLDVVVHPAYGTYFAEDAEFSSDDPILHGSVNTIIDRILDRYWRFMELDGVEPLKLESTLSKHPLGADRDSWRRSLYLSQALFQFSRAADALTEISSIYFLKREKRPLLLILPKGGMDLSYRYREFIDTIGNDGGPTLYLESDELNNGYLFPKGKEAAHLLVDDVDAMSDPRMETLNDLCKENDIMTLRLWGGYINGCLLSAQRSLSRLKGYRVVVDLQKCTPYSKSSKMVFFPHKPGFFNHMLAFSTDDSLGEIHVCLNEEIKNPPDFSRLKDAKGESVLLQYQVIRSYRRSFQMRDRFKHHMALLHPNDYRGPMLNGQLQPVPLPRQGLYDLPSAPSHHR